MSLSEYESFYFENGSRYLKTDTFKALLYKVRIKNDECISRSKFERSERLKKLESFWRKT